MDGNRSARLLALLLIAAIAAVLWLAVFTGPSAQPVEKPQSLMPAEQRDSVQPGKQIGKR